MLTISGTGEMENYYTSAVEMYNGGIEFDSYSSAPWYSSRESIVSIVLEVGVTNIGYFAFYESTSLTSITIPDSVTSIGFAAFYGCTSLTDITIPDGVTSIEMGAFYDCTSLTSINIPDGVTGIETSAFCGCTSLTDITIPSSVTGITYDVFYDCTSLTDIYYDGLEDEWEAFGVEYLEGVTIHFSDGTVSTKGDIDGDGEITGLDCRYALQYYMEQAIGKDESELCLTADEVTRADLNGDGTVTINEVCYIYTYYGDEAAGIASSWDSLLGDGSGCSYTDGDDSIEIGSVEVSLADLEANDYTYPVKVPVTTTCSDSTSLAFGFSLDSALSLNESRNSGSLMIEESSDMYWFAGVRFSSTTLQLVLTVSEDVAVGDTFEITGYLTSPNGAPAIVNGQTATEMISGSVTIVDEYSGSTIEIGTVELALSDLVDGTTVEVPVTAGATSDLRFGFRLCDGLTYSGYSVESEDIISMVAEGPIFYWFAATSSTGATCDPTLEITIDKSVVENCVEIASGVTSDNTLVLPITAVTYAADYSSACVDGEDTPVVSGKIIILLDENAATTETDTTTTTESENTTTTTTTTTTTATTTTTTTTTTKPADLDGDDAITISDAFLCLTAYANSAAGNDSGLTAEQEAAADVDGDGSITIMDASYILQFYAQTAAGNSPTWASILGG